MEWSKMKNIILIILIIANMFLGGLVALRVNNDRQYARAMQADTVSALAASGITIQPELLAAARLPSPVTLQRDETQEAAFAAALLGVCTKETSGTSAVYSGSMGSVIFRSSGSFELQYDTMPSSAGDPAALAVGLLSSAGVKTETVSVSDRQVVLRQTRGDAPLFNCTVTFQFTAQALQTVTGTLLLSAGETAENREPLSVSTCLVRLLADINDAGDICNSITALTPGYLAVASLTAPIELQPALQVTTDTGVYEINALTGAVTRGE